MPYFSREKILINPVSICEQILLMVKNILALRVTSEQYFINILMLII
jgi:hypothetical protein